MFGLSTHSLSTSESRCTQSVRPVGCLSNGNHREGTQPQNFLVLSSNLTVRCSMSFNLLDTSIKPKPEFWVFVPCLVFSSTVPYLPDYTWYLLHFKCSNVCCFGVLRQNQIHMQSFSGMMSSCSGWIYRWKSPRSIHVLFCLICRRKRVTFFYSSLKL